MKLVLAEPKHFKDSIAIISDLVTEAKFKATNNGLKLVAMDPANVAMVNFELLSSCFTKYEIKEEEEVNELSPVFDDFYKHYPKKKNKAQAEKAWNKIKPTADLLEKMLLSLEQQKESKDWKKDNGQFIPYPSSWLNGRRWEDELDSSNNQCESCYYKIHENLDCYKEGRKECKSHRPV